MATIEITIPMILTLLQSEYPNSFANMDERTMALKLRLWEKEFEADDIRLVYAAVRLYMKRAEKFAPSIGQLRQAMADLQNADRHEMTDQDAWALVSRACANGLYGYMEEFAKLPEAVQAAVGAPEQLKAWAAMDEETVQSVVASNFKKTFRASREREKQLQALTPDVRAMLSEIAGGMKMIGGE